MSRVMKDSGIPWIGKIPADWQVGKIKNISDIYSGGTPSTLISSYWDGSICWLSSGEVQDHINESFKKITEKGLRESSTRLIPKGSALLSMIGGNAGYLNIESAINQSILAVEESNKLHGRFAYYWLYCSKPYVECNSDGTAQVGINAYKGKNMPIVIIDVNTQKKIVNFLDTKCKNIDGILEKNKKSIELMMEYKKSLIDKKIWNKEEAPIKIKFTVKLRNEKVQKEIGKFIGLENIESYTGKFISTQSEYDDSDAKLFLKGDLLVNKLRPYLTKSFLADTNGTCTGELLVIKEFVGHMKFLLYLTLSSKFIDIIDSSTYGTKMPRANWEFIRNVSIPSVSLKIQKEAVEYLDKNCFMIDKVIEYRKKVIEKLEEYKNSLIYETVTGKIEV